MNKYVLDSSAILALLLKEKGQERVLEVLEQEEALVSVVNYAEILTRLTLTGFPIEKSLAALENLPLDILPLSQAIATLSATLAPATHPLGLSLGARVCLATANYHEAIALTADRGWKKWKGAIKIELIHS